MKWWNDYYARLQLPIPILHYFPPPNQYEPNNWQKFHPLLNECQIVYIWLTQTYTTVQWMWNDLNKTLIDLLDNNKDFFLLGLDDIPDEQFSF